MFSGLNFHSLSPFMNIFVFLIMMYPLYRAQKTQQDDKKQHLIRQLIKTNDPPIRKEVKELDIILSVFAKNKDVIECWKKYKTALVVVDSQTIDEAANSHRRMLKRKLLSLMQATVKNDSPGEKIAEKIDDAIDRLNGR